MFSTLLGPENTEPKEYRVYFKLVYLYLDLVVVALEQEPCVVDHLPAVPGPRTESG